MCIMRTPENPPRGLCQPKWELSRCKIFCTVWYCLDANTNISQRGEIVQILPQTCQKIIIKFLILLRCYYVHILSGLFRPSKIKLAILWSQYNNCKAATKNKIRDWPHIIASWVLPFINYWCLLLAVKAIILLAYREVWHPGCLCWHAQRLGLPPNLSRLWHRPPWVAPNCLDCDTYMSQF
jgi:hypothetical protein